MKNLLLGALERLGLLRPAFRVYETVAAVRPCRRVPAHSDDGLPVPPRRLIVRVAGTADVEWFLRSGRLAADSIRALLARRDVAVGDVGALLDFGCGCGRVVRRWAGLEGVAVAGSDLNADAIAWCRTNLTFARFETNALEPPVAFEDGRFGLVYALSVFTHLPIELQLRWIADLQRVLAPGGYLVLSAHGEHYAERLNPAERELLAAGEVVVRRPAVAGTNLCAAYHPPAWVREHLGAGLEALEYEREGAAGNPRQDLYLFRKPAG